MAAAAIFTKPSNRYNSSIYQPISTKFEALIQNGLPILANYKTEVQTRKKMATASIIAKQPNPNNSTIY
jgi:hypothetical protein